MGVMQQFNEPNMITTSTDELFNWARKNSLWPLQFSLACCAIEMMSTGRAHNDLDRFGAGFFTASAWQADVMIVSGTVSTKMAERMTRLYEQMPEPKWVITMGACAISGEPGAREFCRTFCSRTRKFSRDRGDAHLDGARHFGVAYGPSR
jgi:NADH-quinone oxidoreductase subunit B